MIKSACSKNDSQQGNESINNDKYEMNKITLKKH